MFCYQRSFGVPTEVVTAEQFRALVTAPKTVNLVKKARELYEKGDKKEYDRKKKGLPLAVFVATFNYSEREVMDFQLREKVSRNGMWRKQSESKLNGLCVVDFDHVDENPEGSNENDNDNDNENENQNASKRSTLNSTLSLRDIWVEAYEKLSKEDRERIVLVYVTPSGHGLKVVFTADPDVGNLIDNQIVFSRKLGLNPDESCKDASRGAFLTTMDDIIFIDEDRLFTYENKEFAEKYGEEYRIGKSQATITDSEKLKVKSEKLSNENTEQARADESSLSVCRAEGVSTEGQNTCHLSPVNSQLEYHGVPYQKIIEAWLGTKKIEQGDRHRTSLVLADHLRYITDNDPKLIEAILRETPFVKEIVEERNEDVTQTVKSAQGYEFLKGIPKRLQKALASVGALAVKSEELKDNSLAEGQDDIYSSMPLDAWATELQEMAKHYPCMKELFLNVHPHKLPAVWFSSAALFGTLMTRAYYHFWYEPEIMRRLNYCIFIIGDPGAGKNIIEKFYKKIADPMIQADSCLIDAVNRYKESRTERTTSSKAQKGDALKRPIVGIRVHPARTATGEFIRHMNAAVETVQGIEMNLHMFSFDAELDNVTKQNKGGDWKDREIMELKAFHNEEEGQMYANQESFTGRFNIYWNFIYTGTPYALHKKVNQRNFGTGMSTRLAVIPLPDKGLAKRVQEIDPYANETLKDWAYRLDKVEGELPIEPLNDETYDWQSSHMEIAEFNHDKADRTLLKRIPYYGIGISLPYILMRHWQEWQEKKTLTMDDMDKRLCHLAMEVQYNCQKFFFGEMAHNYFADQNKEFIQRHRTSRYDECFRKLPDEFKTQQFMDVFGISNAAASRAINRFLKDGVIEKLKYGLYKKVVSELP